jgi:predicted nucleic-acid-binding protein
LIGVDTNVLVRLFIVDDPAQSEAARRFFADRTAADPAFVSLVVLAEFVWLLDDTYGYAHAEIVGVLKDLLASPDFVLERPDFVADAASLAERKRIDIADYLIARVATANGSRAVVTFDRKAARNTPGMELLR